jgi:hypothetical protein
MWNSCVREKCSKKNSPVTNHLGRCAPDGDFSRLNLSLVYRVESSRVLAVMGLLKAQSRYDAMMAKGDNWAIGSIPKLQNSEGRQTRKRFQVCLHAFDVAQNPTSGTPSTAPHRAVRPECSPRPLVNQLPSVRARSLLDGSLPSHRHSTQQRYSFPSCSHRRTLTYIRPSAAFPPTLPLCD